MTGNGREAELIRSVGGRLEARARRTGRIDLKLARQIVEAGRVIAAVLVADGTVFAAGNGGSATQCQHLTSELVGRFRSDRPGMRALPLTAETAALTAIGNDYGFDQIFGRQLAALGGPGDVLIAFSSSGRSQNLLVAAEVARSEGMLVVGVVAGDGGPLGSLCDVRVGVPNGDTAAIQEDHLTVIHLLCEIIELELFDVALGRVDIRGLVSIDEAIEQREHWRENGLTVAWTNGCFDLLHEGHLLALESAAVEADVLIVGLNTDSSVGRLKGAGRPFMPDLERAKILSSLRMVDLVVLVDDDEPSRVLQRIKPDVCCKGSDYEDGKKTMPEKPIVEAYGGRVVFSPLVSGSSTSSMARRIGLTQIEEQP